MEEDKVFDLIFMDIQMPNLDGLQSTRLIRQMGYSAPIVALTAFAEQSNVKDCYDSGMVSYYTGNFIHLGNSHVIERVHKQTNQATSTKASAQEVCNNHGRGRDCIYRTQAHTTSFRGCHDSIREDGGDERVGSLFRTNSSQWDIADTSKLDIISITPRPRSCHLCLIKHFSVEYK